MKYTFEDPTKPKVGEFWLIKTPNGMEGVIILYLDWEFGEAEVIKINAFELGTTSKKASWIKLDECEFQGCIQSNIKFNVDGITGGYNVDVKKEDVDATFTVLEISNAL